MVGTAVAKGWLWQVWWNAIEARILARGGTVSEELVDEGSAIRCKGEALLDLASMCDVVVLGHDPPFEHIAAIKARSTAPGGTKVILGFHNFESINQAVQWQAKWNGIRDILKPYMVRGSAGSGCDFSSVNAYGWDGIDQFERNDSRGIPGQSVADLCADNPTWPPGYISIPPTDATNPETKHSWDVDVYRYSNSGDPASARLAAFWASMAAVADAPAASAGYGPTRPWGFDGWLFDNLKGNPYKGESTLDYPAAYPGQYPDGWRAFLESFGLYFDSGAGAGGFEETDMALWANYGSSVSTYTRTQIRNRFSEHAFRTGPTGASPVDWEDIDANLTLQAQHGHRVVLGQVGTVGLAAYWYTTTGGANPNQHGDWARLVARARELEIADLVYPQAFRTVSGSYIAFQEGWREPT